MLLDTIVVMVMGSWNRFPEEVKSVDGVSLGGRVGFISGVLYWCGQGGHPVDTLVVKKNGRTTGEAFVLYGTPAEVEMALAKNKEYLGNRYVEVFRAKKLVRALFQLKIWHSNHSLLDCLQIAFAYRYPVGLAVFISSLLLH